MTAIITRQLLNEHQQLAEQGVTAIVRGKPLASLQAVAMRCFSGSSRFSSRVRRAVYQLSAVRDWCEWRLGGMMEQALSSYGQTSQAQRQQQRELDLVVLRRLHQQGFLSNIPFLTHDTPHDPFSPIHGPVASPHLDGQGNIRLAQSSYGSPLRVPSLASGDQSLMQHWMVMMHEAAHCEFAAIRAPFCPTNLQVSNNVLWALNEWCFGPVMSNIGQSMLNEMFADTYSAMMLMRSVAHDPRLLEQARDLVERMAVLRHDYRSLWEEYALESGKPTREGLSYLGCDLALRDVLAWNGLLEASPDDLKQRALMIASDTLMRLCRFDESPLAPFQHQGLALSHFVLQATMDPHVSWRAVSLALRQVVMQDGHVDHVRQHLSRLMKEHPCYEDMLNVFDRAYDISKNQPPFLPGADSFLDGRACLEIARECMNHAALDPSLVIAKEQWTSHGLAVMRRCAREIQRALGWPAPSLSSKPSSRSLA